MQAVCQAMRQHYAMQQACVKIQTLQGNACLRLHVDHVHLRAICTYLGPGTEYLPSEAAFVHNAKVLGAGHNKMRDPVQPKCFANSIHSWTLLNTWLVLHPKFATAGAATETIASIPRQFDHLDTQGVQYSPR